MILFWLFPGQFVVMCWRLFFVRRSDLCINLQCFPPSHLNALENFELRYFAGFGCRINLEATMFVPECTCRNFSRNQAFKTLAIVKPENLSEPRKQASKTFTIAVLLSPCASNGEIWVQDMNFKDDMRNGLLCLCMNMPC